MFNFNKAPKTEKHEDDANELQQDNVVHMSDRMVSDPSTGTPLGTADSIDDAKRMIRQAAEDAREAA